MNRLSRRRKRELGSRSTKTPKAIEEAETTNNRSNIFESMNIRLNNFLTLRPFLKILVNELYSAFRV